MGRARTDPPQDQLFLYDVTSSYLEGDYNALAAWGYNRRGEAYVQQAVELAAKGEDRQANELDAVALDDFQQAIAHDKN